MSHSLKTISDHLQVNAEMTKKSMQPRPNPGAKSTWGSIFGHTIAQARNRGQRMRNRIRNRSIGR